MGRKASTRCPPSAHISAVSPRGMPILASWPVLATAASSGATAPRSKAPRPGLWSGSGPPSTTKATFRSTVPSLWRERNLSGFEMVNLRDTNVWRSVFRSGSGPGTLHQSLAIQQNIFFHLSSVKIRKRSLAFQVTWYLGTLSLGCLMILVATGILLMLYYHPSIPQAYADMKDLRFVVSAGLFLRNLHRWSAHAMVLVVFAHMFKVF